MILKTEYLLLLSLVAGTGAYGLSSLAEGTETETRAVAQEITDARRALRPKAWKSKRAVKPVVTDPLTSCPD